MPKVTSDNEVSLNSLFYKIRGDVQKSIGSIYAPKQVIGDITSQSREGVSILKWTDWRGGIGVERFSDSRQANAAWWSEADIRWDNHLMLPPLVTDLTNESGNLINAMGFYYANDDLYAVDYHATAPTVRKTTDGAAFGSALWTFAEEGVVRIVASNFNGTDYLIFAGKDGWEWTSGSTATTSAGTSTKNASDLVIWDDRLWGFDRETRLMWYTLVPGTTEIDDALLPGDAGTFLGFVVYNDALDEPIIYLLTTQGLYAHDAANQRILKTAFNLPRADTLGSAQADAHVTMDVWRGALYIPSGMTVYQYTVGRAGQSIINIGPRGDIAGRGLIHGIPDDRMGNIRAVHAGPYELYAAVETDTASSTISGSKNSILGFDGSWRVIYAHSSGGTSLAMATGTPFNDLRLYFHEDSAIKQITIVTGDIFPKASSISYTFASSAIHQTPWFELGADVAGIALRTKIQVKDTNANETVKVEFRANDASSFTTLGTITSDGVTTYDFPDAGSSASVGIAFRNIQYQLTLSRGGTTTKSPDVVSLSLEYERKLPVRYSYSFIIDAREAHKRRTTKTMLEDLEAAVEAKTKVEFNYKGTDPDLPEYVDIVSIQAVEKSGFTEEGLWQVTVIDR